MCIIGIILLYFCILAKGVQLWSIPFCLQILVLNTQFTRFCHISNRSERYTDVYTFTQFLLIHRQIMFYNNGKTMISINGQLPVTASPYPLYLVTAPNSRSTSDENAITLPITTMFDHIYTCSDGESTSAWLIRQNPNKSEKLVSRVSGCTLDTSTEYLYYIHNSSQLCVMNIEKGLSRSHTLAKNADYYVVYTKRKPLKF